MKAFETETALRDGATEIDMVVNIGALKAKDYELVAKDINGVVRMAHSAGALVKVIIETALLTDEEKRSPACSPKKPARITSRPRPDLPVVEQLLRISP